MYSHTNNQIKSSILNQIFQLNRNNAELYTMFKKLQDSPNILHSTLPQKVQKLKKEIYNKIKDLATNVDTLYGVFDQKIMILIGRFQEIYRTNQQYKQRITILENKKEELLHLLSAKQEKIQTLASKNQQLSRQIHNLSNFKRKSQEQTIAESYNSLRTFQEKEKTQRKTERSDITDSQSIYISPIKQPNSNSLVQNTRDKIQFSEKRIKSQQNSFSSVLLRQQNSMLQLQIKQQKNKSGMCSTNKFSPTLSGLTFGCIPPKQKKQQSIFNNIKTLNSHFQYFKSKQYDNPESQGHRMSFLVENLNQTPKSKNKSVNSFYVEKNCKGNEPFYSTSSNQSFIYSHHNKF